MNNRRTLGVLLVVLATAFWSTSGIFINLLLAEERFTPVSLAFWRDLATFSLLLTGAGLFSPGRLHIQRKDIPWLAAMGVISIGFFHVIWNISVITNGVAIATVLQSTAPIWVAAAARLAWAEPLTGRKITALVLALAGTVLVARFDALAGFRITPSGLALGLLSGVVYGTMSLFGKKLSGDYDAWTILLYIFGFAALVLLPFQTGQPLPWPLPLRALAAFAALVVITTIIGFGLYTTSLRFLQAGTASIAATAEIPFAALLSFLLLSQRLDGQQLAGSLLVIGGVVLISLPRRGSAVVKRQLEIVDEQG